MIEVISGFSIQQELQDRVGRKIDEERQSIINQAFKQEKEKSPLNAKMYEK